MKKYIVRVVCLAAVFLLLCSTAFAGQSVTLDKYGVSFTVPDGLTWVKTEDAGLLSENIKKTLENDEAIGGMFDKEHNYLAVTVQEDRYINAINYGMLSDEELIDLFRETVKKQPGWEMMETSVYYANNGRRWLYIYRDSIFGQMDPYGICVAQINGNAVLVMTYGIPYSTAEDFLDTIEYNNVSNSKGSDRPNHITVAKSLYFSELEYDEESKRIYVKMSDDGSVYYFDNVPAYIWNIMWGSSSVDSWYRTYIEGKYTKKPYKLMYRDNLTKQNIE